MSNLSNVILDEIDQIVESEFDATVDVCISLFENYTKAYDMNIYAEQSGLQLPDCLRQFNERFIQESDETFFRRKKEDGTMEHIIVSILKIPVRLFAILIKSFQSKRIKVRAKTFETSMNNLEEHIQEARTKYKNVIGASDKMFETRTFNEQKNVNVSDGKASKKETIKVSLDPLVSDNRVLSINLNLDEMISNQEKINKIISDYNESTKDFNDYKSAIKSAKQALKSKNNITDSLGIKFDSNHTYTTNELINSVNTAYKTFDESEDICNKYKSTLESLISVIETSHKEDDRPKSDSTILNGLKGWEKDMVTIITITSNEIKCTDVVVSVCMNVAQKFLDSEMNKKNS